MMESERLQYYLRRSTTIITDEDYTELVKDYFKAPKGYWYSESIPARRIKGEKIKQFWQLIRKFAMPRSIEAKFFNFDGFIFPEFEKTSFTWHMELNGSKGEMPSRYDSNFWKENAMMIFNHKVSFKDAIFLGETYFEFIVFNQSVNFRNSTFKNELLIRGSKFYDNVFFLNAKFEQIKVIDIEKANGIFFHSHNFTDGAFFQRVNLTTTSFFQCDLTHITFKECDWGNHSRIRLYDEKDKLSDHRDIKGLEELYRQLKRKFDSNKDWELSGKAYVSEMEMRKKRLWKQGNYYHWFIYWFYGFFGGYTQNLLKPILSMIALVILFSGIYYFIDYDILYALQRGTKGALPYLSIDIAKDNQFNGYWLIARNIELILGGTFLSFFILALRKRFKQ